MIRPELVRILDSAFRALAPLMGQLEDLESQQPIMGLGPWQPLTLDYIKRKGSANFFVYNALLSGHHQPRRSSHEILHDLTHGSHRDPLTEAHRIARLGKSLIETVDGLSGLAIFGQPDIQARDWQEMPVSMTAGLDPPNPAQVRCTIWIRPYGKLTRSAMPRIEWWLEQQGAITRSDRIKLTNPQGWQRPLVRPWLAFWADVRIPQAIEDALNARFPHVRVKVLRSWDTGPF